MLAVGLGCGSGKAKQPEPVPEPTHKASHKPAVFGITSLGEPVRGARAWANALVPNARGGWNFITQTYEHGSPDPTEFVVVDLETGTQSTTEGPSGIYTNSNYHAKEQLRARNGRVFFPQVKNHLAYYDPTDEVVKQLGQIADGDDTAIYRMVFGPDGKLYGGTQANDLPMVFVVDPSTLDVKVLGRVGRARRGYSYAYYLAPDPPWLYVAVGQSPWQLVALNMKTGEQRILATRADEGFIQFDLRPAGVTATLISGLRTARQKREVVWCINGRTRPFKAGKPPFRPRDVRPRDQPVDAAPELDLAGVNPDSAGVGRVKWRTRGVWRETTFRVKHTSPVDIESLLALPDGSLVGNAKQYHGFFRFDPKGRSLQRLGPLGISRGPRAVLGDLAYFAGYPRGVLYVFDSRQPWSSSNPRLLGNFATAGAHYAHSLIPGPNGRLYYAGRRERDGVGSGVGYYDPATQTFAGHHDRLEALEPRGLAVTDDRVIFSGRSATGHAQLVVYDLQLVERERLTVMPGLASTGAIFSTSQKDVIIGVVPEARQLYRYDIGARRLVASRRSRDVIGAFARRAADGSLWYTVGTDLYRIDATTFDETLVGTLPETPSGADVFTWLGDRLYWASGSKLAEITAP